MSILGNRVRRIEDPRFLTVGGTYTADLSDPLLESAAYVTFVRSTMAHARIESVEVDEAREAPGVLGVYTADDVAEIGGLGPVPMNPPMYPPVFRRPWLATGVVRFVGEPVAVVVSESQAEGEDAAELVWPDLEPLEAVLDPRVALEGGQLLFPDHGTNVAVEMSDGELDDHLFDECEVVVNRRIVHQRLAACPLEGRSAAAVWSAGRLVEWLSTQNVHGARDQLADVYDLAPEQVHAITPDVGGGFGAKINPYAEELLLPWLARQVDRPVRWVETRSENLLTSGHGRAQVHDLTLGGSRDGSLQALRVDVLADSGAYPNLASSLPYFTRKMAPGVYTIPSVETRARSVVTNTMSTVAYRGAGRPEATESIERAVDLFAAEIGLDPAEVRRRNLIPPDAFPYETATRATYDSGDYEHALDLVLGTAGYQELRAEQARRREADEHVQLGIGLSTYVEITAGPRAGSEFAEIRIAPDGSATVRTGTSPHGHGHDTSWAMLACDELGIPMDRITVVHGDTDLVARGEGTMGSRSLQLGGAAVQGAARSIVDRAREIAAALLEADPADVVLDRVEGRFHVAGTPAVSRSWSEVVAAAGDEVADDGALLEQHDFQAPTPTYPFGAHLAVVEVDTETGRVTLQRFVSCDDAGRIINPLIVEGQRHGGIAQGAAQALLEELVYDADGNPVTANLADYAMVSSTELPSFELVDLQTETPANPLGAKGIGESGTIGATPAVHNAVIDALAPFGVRHVDLPLTAEKVWRAITAGDSGGR